MSQELDSKKIKTADDAAPRSILQLTPKGRLVLPTGNADEDSVESHRIVINNKLLDTAIRLVETPRLDVILSDDESRASLSALYNDIWDCLLVHGKAGKVDVRVVTQESTGSAIIIWSAGENLFPTCLQGSTSLADHVKDEAETPYVLFDNPKETRLYKRKRVALGGTFDHFHVGHMKLLTVAVHCSEERVIVGVTSDAMLVNKKNKEKIESVETRFNRVKAFTAAICPPHLQCDVVVIDDPYGPTVTISELDGIVCSSETLKGANAVNEERKKRGMGPLLPIVVLRSNVYSLSSTFIRDKLSL